MTPTRNLENLDRPENPGNPGYPGLQGHRCRGSSRTGRAELPNNAINSHTYKRMSISVDGSREPCEDGFTMQKHAAKLQASETATVAIDPTRVNMLNAAHLAHAPVQSKTALLYVSGSGQITEFHVSDAGFTLLVWQSLPVKGDKHRVELTSYQPASQSANGLWKQLEVDCLSGHARLSDRASVRGVGGNPENRKSARATDDVATVCNWIRRAERWFDKRTLTQRKAILRANGALAQGATEPGDTRIPFLPPSMEFQLQAEAELNRDVYANVMPQHINVGCVKHWDQDGALIQRGRRVSPGTSTRALTGKKDRIAVLRAMATRQVTIAAEKEREGNLVESEIYAEMAADSDARAQALQNELCARMAVARAARTAKKAAKLVAVTAKPAALANVRDELTGVDRERAASLTVADTDEA